MPKKKAETVTVTNDSPISIVQLETDQFKIVSIAFDKNSNLYGITNESKVLKYNPEKRTWETV